MKRSDISVIAAMVMWIGFIVSFATREYYVVTSPSDKKRIRTLDIVTGCFLGGAILSALSSAYIGWIPGRILPMRTLTT